MDDSVLVTAFQSNMSEMMSVQHITPEVQHLVCAGINYMAGVWDFILEYFCALTP